MGGILCEGREALVAKSLLLPVSLWVCLRWEQLGVWCGVGLTLYVAYFGVALGCVVCGGGVEGAPLSLPA